MLLVFKSSANNLRGPEYTERILETVWQSLDRRTSLTLGFTHHNEDVLPYCDSATDVGRLVQSGINAFYPEAETTTLADSALKFPPGWRVAQSDLLLTPEYFPIRRHGEFVDGLNREFADPLSGLFELLASIPMGRMQLTLRKPTSLRRLRAGVIASRLAGASMRSHPRFRQLIATAASSRCWFVRRAADALILLVGGSVDVRASDELNTAVPDDRESDVSAAYDKITGHRLFEARLRLSAACPPTVSQDFVQANLRSAIASLGAFTSRRGVEWRRVHGGKRGFLLSSEEVATLWHLPSATVHTTRLGRTQFTELEPPAVLPDASTEGDVTTVGRVRFRERTQKFGIRNNDRMRHMVMVGKTGTGKSTLLYNTILSDIEQSRGIGLIDPHGDLAEQVLAAIPKNRTRDVVLVDAGDTEFPVAFNPLDCPAQRLESLIASGIVGAFRKLNPDSWGPRLEDILRNSIRLLLEKPGSTLISLQRLLSDESFRSQAIRDIRDPAIRSYWHHEFSQWSKNERTIAVSSVLNKIGPFLGNPILRAIVGQPRSRVRLREVMDDERILIVNLSKGRMGEDASALLGSMMLTGLQIAAMSRADISEADRRPFFAYVDEFQNFATESFATILSEARKYRLGLTLAHQYIDQVDEKTRGAVFGNVENLLCFRVGATDSDVLSEEFGGAVEPADLTRLPKFTAYIRMAVAGMPQPVFNMSTLPPKAGRDGDRSDVARRTSNHRYAVSRSTVNAAIESAYRV